MTAIIGRVFSNMVDYPFPVREGQIAHLVLPRDLKASEVKRLHAFMATLVTDDSGDHQGTPGLASASDAPIGAISGRSAGRNGGIDD
jgi:hypothetical protein